MELIDALHWRYATKKMNGRAVPQEHVDQILEAARLAPTSSGLQPFQVLAISDPALRAKIQPIAAGQSQIVDGSHLLVFAAWDNYTPERISTVFARTSAARGLPSNAMDAYKEKLVAIYGPRPADANFEHAARQAYIGFGIVLAAAAELRVDATPMEGFNNSELDELLGLRAMGLRSVTLLALGYRDESSDWLLNMKKVRQPKEEFVITLN